MLLYSTEMDVQFMEVGQKCSERSTLCHFSKSIDILREAFTAISELTIWTWNVCVSVVDITREKASGMHLTPVDSHPLTVFTASIEVDYFICAEHIVHILC